jgi:hypothetical protein
MNPGEGKGVGGRIGGIICFPNNRVEAECGLFLFLENKKGQKNSTQPAIFL